MLKLEPKQCKNRKNLWFCEYIGGDDKLKISSRKVSIWGSKLQTILSNFPIYLLFRSFKKTLLWPNYFFMFSAARPVGVVRATGRPAVS